MLLDADRVARGFAIVAVALVALGAGIVAPGILIPDVQNDVEMESAEALRYVEARIGNTGGPGQKAARMRISIVESRPDPRECDWGYPEPVTEIFTVRTYTLWGIPLESWEVTCNSERLIGGPASW